MNGYKVASVKKAERLLPDNAFYAYVNCDCDIYERDTLGCKDYALKWFDDAYFFKEGVDIDTVIDYFDGVYEDCFAPDCD